MREHKIGEIFEYNGEWYQCVEGTSCRECDFSSNNATCDIHRAFKCTCKGRSDETSVVFKKLEKVGEPYMTGNKLIQRYKIYSTTYCINVYGWYYQSLDVKSWTIDIEIKQNKEDMEIHRITMSIDDRDYLLDRLEAILHDAHCQQYKDEICEAFSKYIVSETTTDLKPFDLNAAKTGKPVCTRDGRKVRIICFDKEDIRPIVALIKSDKGGESAYYYYVNGMTLSNNYQSVHDLMMLPEKKEGWVNVYYNRTDGITFSKHPYPSKEEAIKNAGTMSNIIDTVNISWKE